MSEMSNEEIARYSESMRDAVEMIRMSFYDLGEDGDKLSRFIGARALMASKREGVDAVAFELAALAHVGAALLRFAVDTKPWSADEVLAWLSETVQLEYLLQMRQDDE